MRGGGFTTFELVEADGSTRTFGTCGRFAQMLRALIEAGESGVTSLTLSQSWAVRVSHYVFRLRRDHNLLIETQREEHGGPFEGHHGRYVLRSRVRVIEGTEIAARVAARIAERSGAAA